MFRNRNVVRKAVAAIGAAARDAISDLEAGRVQQEPAITDRFVAYVQSKLNGKVLAGVHWSAVTLGDRGPGSAESQLGADLLSVVRLELDNFSIAKGFLAQAKLVEPSTAFPASANKYLKIQCEKMLKISPASFVFIYSKQSGILVLPALDVIGARNCNPHELTTRTIPQFFTEHFECFIGDHRFKAATGDELQALREESKVRKVLALLGRPGTTESRT